MCGSSDRTAMELEEEKPSRLVGVPLGVAAPDESSPDLNITIFRHGLVGHCPPGHSLCQSRRLKLAHLHKSAAHFDERGVHRRQQWWKPYSTKIWLRMSELARLT